MLGAADPSSGTASLHEVIKGFGELLKQGWKPLRTIVIASWDAEEVNCRSYLPVMYLTRTAVVRYDWEHRMGRRLLRMDR